MKFDNLLYAILLLVLVAVGMYGFWHSGKAAGKKESDFPAYIVEVYGVKVPIAKGLVFTLHQADTEDGLMGDGKISIELDVGPNVRHGWPERTIINSIRVIFLGRDAISGTVGVERDEPEGAKP